MPDARGPINLAGVLCEELKQIRGTDVQDQKLENVFSAFHEQNLSALCFSGGGIRSATFGLGIALSLAKRGLLDEFDYLSTVSGGGYMGSWLSAWIRREQVDNFEADILRLSAERQTASDPDKIQELETAIEAENKKLFDAYQNVSNFGVKKVQDRLNARVPARPVKRDDPLSPNTEPRQLQFLREYSNFMSPKVGLLSADTWTLIAIYLRNLFLDWTIFVPLLAAIMLFPKILLYFTSLTKVPNYLAVITFGLGILAGVKALYFAMARFPGTRSDGVSPTNNTDSGVFRHAIVPLLTLAFSMTTLRAWFMHGVVVDGDWYRFFSFHDIYDAVIFSLVPMVIWMVLKIFFSNDFFSLNTFAVAASVLIATVTGEFLISIISSNWFDNDFFGYVFGEHGFWHLRLYLIFAVPVFLLIFLIAATIFVGLSSKISSDDQREWVARFGAWILIACVGWVALTAVVLLVPPAVLVMSNNIIYHPDKFYNYVKPGLVTIFGLISGLVSLAGGFTGKSLVNNQSTTGRLSKFLSFAPQIAAVFFLGFLLAGVASLSTFLVLYVQDIFVLDLPPLKMILYLLSWAVGLALIGIVMSYFLNVNKFSLHGAYRDRLVRAYLGASHLKRNGNTFTGFDDSDNFQLHRMKGQKPFHIINAALNLVGGKNLAWQNRRAANFTMSPLHCGSWSLGYRQTNEYSRNEAVGACKHIRYCNKWNKSCGTIENCDLPGKGLRLGTAMAISGAAANPNMGYYSSPVVTFLMSVFNIRLGWWLGNTGQIGSKKSWFGYGKQFCVKNSPTGAVLPLINETLGRTDLSRKYLNVSDGGHFENLALYEMVLRRCRFILVSDAAADKEFKFSEISNAIQKCYVDLGVTIKFENGRSLFEWIENNVSQGVEKPLVDSPPTRAAHAAC